MAKSPDAFRTISEVADWLGVQAHVLRFWESKFNQVKPIKRAGGRRYYRPTDMLLLGGIKKLLHDDGLTIKGVQKVLREQGLNHVADQSQALDDLTMAVIEGGADDPRTPQDAPAENSGDTEVDTASVELREDLSPALAVEDGATGAEAAAGVGDDDVPQETLLGTSAAPEEVPEARIVTDAEADLAPDPLHAPDLPQTAPAPPPVDTLAEGSGQMPPEAAEPPASEGHGETEVADPVEPAHAQADAQAPSPLEPDATPAPPTEATTGPDDAAAEAPPHDDAPAPALVEAAADPVVDTREDTIAAENQELPNVPSPPLTDPVPEPETAQEDDAPRPDKDGIAAGQDQLDVIADEPPVLNVKEVKPRVVDVPPLPVEADMPAHPSALSALARAHVMASEPRNAAKPLLAQLIRLRASMANPRKDAGKD